MVDDCDQVEKQKRRLKELRDDDTSNAEVKSRLLKLFQKFLSTKNIKKVAKLWGKMNL